MRFEQGLTVAQIATTMRLDQKGLYRPLDRLLRDLRRRWRPRASVPRSGHGLLGEVELPSGATRSHEPSDSASVYLRRSANW